MLTDVLMIVGGLAILTVGAEALIRGATEIARRLGLSELVIGLTLVGFGTSTPELVSSVQAALQGSPGIAVGNVVGSNIANVLLILGVAALIAPVSIEPRAFRRDAAVVIVSTLLVIGIGMTVGFTRAAGFAFLAALASYVTLAYLMERRATGSPEAERHEAAGAAMPGGPKSIIVDLVFAAAGLGLLILGARLLILGSIDVAGALGVSDTIIGLTIVAVGTSLPELVTSAMATARGKGELALGNIIGSNIYNLLGIVGVTAAIRPLVAPPEILAFDNWVMLASTLAMVWFARSARSVTRLEGGVLLLAYAVYLFVLAVNAMG
jgi:cation:H+ antiporter